MSNYVSFVLLNYLFIHIYMTFTIKPQCIIIVTILLLSLLLLLLLLYYYN